MPAVRINTSQGSDYSGGTSAALAVSAAALAAGNFIVVTFRLYNPSNNIVVNSVTDTAGNTYYRATDKQGATTNCRTGIFYAFNTLAHATNIVTINLSGAAAYWGVTTAQYSGVRADINPLDVVSAGSQATATSITSDAFSTKVKNELIIANFEYDAATGQTWTAGSGFAIAVQDASTVQMMQEMNVSEIQTSITASATLSTARNLEMNVATFQTVGGQPKRFYLMGRSSPEPVVSPTPDASWEQTGTMDRRLCVLREYVKKRDNGATYANGATIPITTTQDILITQYVSEPLLKPQTISGTLNAAFGMYESANTLNCTLAVVLRVLSGDGLTVRGTLFSVYGTDIEFDTTNNFARIINNAALTPVTAQDGDILVMEVGARATAPSASGTADNQFTYIQNFPDCPHISNATPANGVNFWFELSELLMKNPQINNYQEVRAPDGISVGGKG